MSLTKTVGMLILVFTLLPGCSSMSPIKGASTPRNILETIEPGDLIKVETIDGQTYEIKVTSISLESVKGGGTEIALKDIKTINSKQFSLVKTTGAVSGVLFLNALILYSVFISI